MISVEIHKLYHKQIRRDAVMDFIYGNPEATIEVTGYINYECPRCRETFTQLKQVLDEHLGEIKLRTKFFPDASGFNNALICANAVAAAGKQDKFWEMHEGLLKKQPYLNRMSIEMVAQEIGLDMNKFHEDMEADDVVDKVLEDYHEAKSMGISKAPAIFLKYDNKTASSPIFIKELTNGFRFSSTLL